MLWLDFEKIFFFEKKQQNPLKAQNFYIFSKIV